MSVGLQKRVLFRSLLSEIWIVMSKKSTLFTEVSHVNLMVSCTEFRWVTKRVSSSCPYEETV